MTDGDDVLCCFLDVIPRMFHTLMQGFEFQVAQSAGIKKTQMKALLTLARTGEIPLSQISWYVGIERGSMTAVARKLEAGGLITAGQDAADKRKVLVRLTPEGEILSRACADEIRSTLAARTRLLPEEDRFRIRDACALFREVMENSEGRLS